MMEDPLIVITRYLALKKLVNDNTTLLAVKDYYVDGLSPSTIGYKYKISKFRVRGYIQRITDKTRSHLIATNIIKKVFPLIMNIEPVVIKVSNKYLCLLCDQTFNTELMAENHLKKKHKDFFNNIVNQIVQSARKQVS